jgi:nucleotide-binding universal stress UspA family protein
MELAEASAAQIKLLVVAQLPEPPSEAESSAKIRLTTERFADAFAHIKTEGRSHGIDIETKVVEGDPATEIVQQAADERSDLIVMVTLTTNDVDRIETDERIKRKSSAANHHHFSVRG